MGRLFLHYERNDSYLCPELKVKVDDSLTFTVEKTYYAIIDLPDGMHNIKMYCGSKEMLYGYLEDNILIIGDTFYIYSLKNKAKLKKVNCNSIEKFNKKISNSNFLYYIFFGMLIMLYIILQFFR